jgi:hypothetical protein
MNACAGMTGCGAFSNVTQIPHGLDLELELCRPLTIADGNGRRIQRVHFAGESVGLEHMGSLHGAFMTGVRAGQRVCKLLTKEREQAVALEVST